MRPLALVTLALTLALVPASARAQYRGVRFEIRNVGDTTFAFPIGPETWVKPGLTGIAVDPARRDALVARFRILAVSADEATAVVTGQTTRVRMDHMVVIQEPRRPWFRSRQFWGGLAVGALLGAGVGFAR